jgi:enoyl-CoA hydratase
LVVDHPADGVVRLRIDNPPANALNAAARDSLIGELDRIDGDSGVRCAILTGTGDAFSAGADLVEQRAVPLTDREAYIREVLACLERLEESRVPVIAAVNGLCHGGGLELALCCQIRIAARSATFVASGVNIGLIVSFQRLPQTIGKGPALEMLLTGDTCSAPQAERWGLVTQVYDSVAALEAAALRLATRIASRAPLSVQTTKEAALHAFELTSAEGRHEQVARFLKMSATEDHHEALDAFCAHRQPVFRGR